MRPGLFPWWWKPKTTAAHWARSGSFAWTYEYSYVWGARKVDQGKYRTVIRWTE